MSNKNRQITEQDILQATWREKWLAYRAFLKIIIAANPRLAFFRGILLALGAFLQPIEIYVFSLFIAAIATGKTVDAPLYITVVVLAYGFRILVINLTYSRIDDWFSRNASLAVQQKIFDHMARLEPERLTREDVRRDLDFVREDLWRLNNLSSNTEWLIRSCLKFIGAAGLALVAPWWTTGLIIVHAFLEAMTHGAESKTEIWTSTWNSLDGRRIEYTRYLFLGSEEFRELRLLDATSRLLRKLKASASRIVQRFRHAAFISARNRTLLTFLHVGAYGLVISILGMEAFSGPAALATLYVAINLFGLMGEALSGISSAYNHLAADLGILSRVHHLISLPPEIEHGLPIPKGPLVIQFQNVSYRYPEARKDALQNVTVTLREGEHLAIVGENGAGKSTFLRLLSGLEKPTRGRMLVNGLPLESYRPAEWRHAFHLMLQGAKLYQDFVRENLLFGEPKGRWKKEAFSLERGVAIAGADAVIREVPEGYETFLGDWAAPPGIVPHRVSGGQQQKLLIARSLIHGGRILGFDEPTSSMDTIAEKAFFDRLHDAMAGRGLIFISHRFSTVRRASRILVFHEGRLIEDGEHDLLLSRGGEYAKLYTEQAQWYA